MLKKSDFQVHSTSLVAPLALTAFTGPPAAPLVLCSISLDGEASAEAAENVVALGATETAEYAGSTSGSKASRLSV